jgi:hypothetical protein
MEEEEEKKEKEEKILRKYDRSQEQEKYWMNI